MKHGKIISSFVKASEQAKKLEEKMHSHILSKKADIEKIAAEIEEVNAVKEQTSKFSKNLLKLIGNEEIVVPLDTADNSTDESSAN